MGAKINLIGQRFGKIIVLEETSQRKNKSVVWKCQCDCGNICYFSTKDLRNDGIIQCTDCGHTRMVPQKRLQDIVGKKFNHLTVLEKTSKIAGGKILYKCQCDCSNKTITYVNRTDLTSGHTQSCGCIKRKYQPGQIINNRLILEDPGVQKNKYYYLKCKCLFCGRQYYAMAQTLDCTISCGCQKSVGEFKITKILQDNQIKFIPQYMFPNTRFRFDFALISNNRQVPYRLIEFDGEQHFLQGIKQTGWSTKANYEKIHIRDLEKNKLAKRYGIPLVRIPYWERHNLTLELLMSDKYLVIEEEEK